MNGCRVCYRNAKKLNSMSILNWPFYRFILWYIISVHDGRPIRNDMTELNNISTISEREERHHLIIMKAQQQVIKETDLEL